MKGGNFMISSSKRVWISSVALSSILLLGSLPGVFMPVKASEHEHPKGLETVLLKSSSGFTAQTVRSKLIASANNEWSKKDKLSESIQVVAELNKTEVKTEVKTVEEVAAKTEPKTETKTQAQTVAKSAPNTQTSQRPVQVASAPTQVSRGADSSGIVKNAMSLQGVPYVFGGNTRKGFDCSGYTQYVFKGSGINLPRTSYAQFEVGTAVKKDQLQPGDLVFFTTYAAGPSHVGVYIGGGQFVHASNSGVRTTSMSDSYYSARYVGARRV
jgi:cell wall-associated NlpC family hydrolase